jgi:hypothetical protein
LQLLSALPGVMSNVLDVRVLGFASVFQHRDISRTRHVLARHQLSEHTALLACRPCAKNNKSMVHAGHRSGTDNLSFRTEPSEHI